MEQSELICVSNTSLNEMRVAIEKVVSDFPKRNNDYLRKLLKAIIREIQIRDKNVSN